MEHALLFGPQCSGKTIFATNVLQGWEYISLGSIVRQTDILDQKRIAADSLIKEACEWPPELGLDFIATSLRKNLGQCNVVIDGYPKHERELVLFQNFLDAEGLRKPSMIFEVTASKEVLLNRFIQRSDRHEGSEFFELRYKQYIEFKKHLADYALKNKVQYYTINTDSPLIA